MLESVFNKVAGLQASNFIKKRLQHRCLLVIIAKFLRAPILKNTRERCYWSLGLQLKVSNQGPFLDPLFSVYPQMKFLYL